MNNAYESEFTIGSIIEGEVVRLKPFGAIMQLPDRTQGLIHISELSDGFVRRIDDFVTIGDKLPVKVIAIDEKTRRVSLSLKQAGGERAQRAERGSSVMTLDERLKKWLKDSCERQADVNRRNKRNKGR